MRLGAGWVVRFWLSCFWSAILVDPLMA
jgi:hypothetical protein